MARVALNSLTQHFSGAIGGLVFRRVGNVTVVGQKAKPRKKQSERQRENREMFKRATFYAKQAMNDPQRKVYYQQKAKKLKLPNAYTAAITEFMRKGEIKDVNVKHNGKGERSVVIRTTKKDFAVTQVKVTVKDKALNTLHDGEAIRNSRDLFVYSLPADITSEAQILRVSIPRPDRNDVFREIVI